MQLERWRLDWERDNGGFGDPALARADWFDEDNLALVFLPTANSWDCIAYISMYGASDYGAEYYIALLRRWNERFGAELVAHFGTMLQFLVSRAPAAIADAWDLAVEQYLAAPCTLDLPGTALRYHAAGLVDHDRWFLHERP